jgi:hypothetical protein
MKLNVNFGKFGLTNIDKLYCLKALETYILYQSSGPVHIIKYII